MSLTTVTGETRFVFVCPMYNMAATLPRLLHSICGQSYANWRLILIDDVSSREQAILEKETIDGFRRLIEPGVQEGESKIQVIWNDEKRWEVANVLHGISLCSDDDVVCRIDADDWLVDLDALAMIESVYEMTNVDCLWTAHRWGFSERNISGPMADGADPYTHPWVSSHLKTFRKKLINDVKDENFRGEDGEYIKRAGDQAIYLPVLANSKRRAFLNRVVYHYTIDDVPATYQTPDALFQRDEAVFLRQRGFIK